MVGMAKIRLCTHDYPIEILRARTDYAKACNQPLVERPYWYEHTETGQTFHDLYGCIGWPSEVNDSNDEFHGYCAIVGVVKSKHDASILNAKFQLIDEIETEDVTELLSECVKLRKEYGFGIQDDLLTTWTGDPDRFLTTLALKNEQLMADGGNASAILLSPPHDFYSPKVFDMYVRALRAVLVSDNKRLYLGYNDILHNRLREFLINDPAIMAVGGLVHTLLCQCRWMDSQGSNVVILKDY